MRTRIILLLILFVVVNATAQTVREKIDSERGGSFLDPKALDKARSFIGGDGTDYLGYCFEGAFLFFRAIIGLGFRKALRRLQKALVKIEKNYVGSLRTLTINFN